ncbi:fatty acid desaturase family protein [Glaciecola petra]|uniref:Fatty acid desaturase family protein n=1 Tax=Glaciecola petra TaxID=3075602 RepID=A0ABU2ZMW5_9ALTE|nr:fatty acid desaturase family protein [Aestuariibacter sp. P117]MDT0593750.1 fatty acid desaturase family protein [Aestuariibacter sp. P117]
MDTLQDIDLKTLTKKSFWKSSAYIFLDISILFCILIVAWQTDNIAITLVAILLIARQQNALGVLAHEASHLNLYKSKNANLFIGRAFMGACLGISFDAYKHAHFLHHKHMMTKKDPDLVFIEKFPIAKNKLWLQFLPDLLGLSWLYLNLYYLNYARKNKIALVTVIASLVPGLIWHIGLISLCFMAGKWWFYFLYWVLPMTTLVPMFMHIRGICEHAGREPSRDAFRGARSVKKNGLAMLVAPHNYNYHVEHHLVSNVPHYNIPRLHKSLKENEYYCKEAFAANYREAIEKLIV